MPSMTTASFDDDFMSDRLLNCIHNGEYKGLSNSQESFNGLTTIGMPASAQKAFSLDKDGCFALSNRSNSVSCNSPTLPNGYGAMASPHLMAKYANGMINSAFTTPNPATKLVDDFHSLQNSPFYSHYPVNGMSSFKRPVESPGGNFLMNGNIQRGDCYGIDGLQRRPPQRELFPQMSRCDNGWPNSMSMNGNLNGQPQALMMQDRLMYNTIAQKRGYIVGNDLERIKENSRRSTSHSYGRISAHFRHRYGETEAKTKAAYLQIGVRVPSKDHVSEIVGKGGQKIKMIREETGALITTPGEYEDHVFIIEAPPDIALRVGDLISSRAQEITQSKLSSNERRRGSTSSIPGGMSLFSVQSTNGANNGGGRLMSRSPDELPAGTLPSPAQLLKSGAGINAESGGNFTNGGFPGSANGGTGSNGRVLLARSKISVPQDMVGKIIGTQGSIITTIQKDTGTEIKSPPKEATRGPSATSDFEISAYQSLGMNTNQAAECRVQQAKQLIGHLVMRQFERRASEEMEDGSSNKSRKNSSGEEGDDNGSSSSGSAGAAYFRNKGWLWPDVAQMDSTEAREVLDRILAESKNKTRRAKELAAASGSVPPSPGVTTNCIGGDFFPSDKVVTAASCHNSPFHQPRTAMASQQSAQNGYCQNAGPAQVNLLNGFMSERRMQDYHSTESDFPDHPFYGSGSNGFWANPTTMSHFAAPRHSFSAGASAGTGNSPPMIRRHTMASDVLDHRQHPEQRHAHQLLLEHLSEGILRENPNPSVRGGSPTSFDFIHALDQLCLGEEAATTRSGMSRGGFMGSHGGSTDPLGSLWPPSNSTAAANFFSNGGGSDGLSDGSTNSDAAIRSIWADTPASGVNGDHSSPFTFTSNHLPTPVSPACIPTFNRCGTIGEGRRRPSPPSTTKGPSEVVGSTIPAV